MVAQNIFFYVIAAVMVGAAVMVVTSRNVVRAALALIVVFGGVAAQFILLAGEFVAATQVLVYIGVMGYALVDAFGDDALPADRELNSVNGSNTATISDAIFGQYLIPFEVISVLLLAALVGAIVIARKDR